MGHRGNGRRRVVVTGMGVVSPLGLSVDDVLGRPRAGKVGHRSDHPGRHVRLSQ